MSRRILVFGNSHCACLKEAVDCSEDSKRDQFVFFASRAKRIRALNVQGDRLVPTDPKLTQAFAVTSGGYTEVSFDEVTAIVLVGLGLILKPFPPVFYSSAVKSAAIARIVERSTLAWISRKIRKLSRAPIFAFHDPLPSIGYSDAQDAASGVDYAEMLQLINEYMESNGLGVQVIPQPAETMRNWCTKSEFSVGSKRLAIGAQNDQEAHPETDYFHMNRDFGAKLLDEIEVCLSSLGLE